MSAPPPPKPPELRLERVKPNGDPVCRKIDWPVTDHAKTLVNGDRGAVYGPPHIDFAKVTGMAKALWGRGPETPAEHALYMVLVKLSRLEATPGHHDSIVDAIGYLETYRMVLREDSSMS